MVPIGIQDFAKLRRGGYYYVDKTDLIARILENRAEVQLFTRPRRFGKSLNLSMLDAYLNLRYDGNDWFEGLSISERHEFDDMRNRCPVICFDMKDLSVLTYDEFLNGMREKVAELYRDHSDSLAGIADPKLRKDSDDLRMGVSDEDVLSRSLRTLSEILAARHGRGAIILMDEYDSPVLSACEGPVLDRVLDFMGIMLGSALKGNRFLDFAVIAGVTRAPMESMFPGLNNIRINDVFDRRFDEMFGFTEEEVERLCADFGHPERYPEAREWYDGYLFGDSEVYNPWSLLCYVDSGFVPAPYWAGTSGNGIVSDLMARADDEVYRDLMTLGSGGTIVKRIDASVTYRDLDSDIDSLYSVMVASGYLTARIGDLGYELSIPNREMYGVFAAKVSEAAGPRGGKGLDVFTRALLRCDTDAMEASLYDLIADTVSSRVLDNEHSYQAFLAGLLLHLEGRYRVTADMEGGQGYYDIRLERVRGSSPNVVIEVKRTAGTGVPPERLAEDALEQIVRKDYLRGLEGETVLYGVAFDGKVPVIRSRIVGRRTDRGGPSESMCSGPNPGAGPRIRWGYAVDQATQLLEDAVRYHQRLVAGAADGGPEHLQVRAVVRPRPQESLDELVRHAGVRGREDAALGGFEQDATGFEGAVDQPPIRTPFFRMAVDEPDEAAAA